MSTIHNKGLIPVKAALIFNILQFLLGPKLWLSTKLAPTIPLFNSLPNISGFIEYALIALFFGLHICAIIRTKKSYLISILVLYVLLATLDMNRFIVYYYETALILLIGVISF